MSKLALQLFGGFALRTAAGDELRIPPGKVRVLLAYLAQRPGKAYSRAHLIGFLWGDHPEAAARHSLSQALTMLRRSAGPVVGPKVGDPETIALDFEQVEIDVVAFRALIDQHTEQALDRAAEIYGPPLIGLDVAEADVQDWLAATRLELQELAVSVHERLLALARTAGDRTRTVRIARELLEIDPAAEAAHHALIADLAAQGNLAQALRQYRLCRQRMQDELGVGPGEEIQALVRDLAGRSGGALEKAGPADPSRPAVLVAPVRSFRSGNWTLVQGIVQDVAAEFADFRSAQAQLSTLSVGSDPAASVAELSAKRGFSYGLAISVAERHREAKLEVTLVRASDGAVLWEVTEKLDPGAIFNPGSIAGPAISTIERDWLDAARAIPEEEWSGYTHLLCGSEIYFNQWNAPETWGRAMPYFETAVARGAASQARARRDSMRAHLAIWPGQARIAIWPGQDDYNDVHAAFMASCDRTLAADPTEPNVRRMMATGYLHTGRISAAHWHFARGLRDTPNDPNLNITFSRYLTHIGQPRRALAMARRAQQLKPLHPDCFWEQIGLALYALERYDEALAALRRVRSPSYYEHLYVAACQIGLEHGTAAAQSIEQALADMSDLRLSAMDRLLPYQDQTLRRRLHRHLRAAGLPR
jgi:DNA-binding SARP family transcriptional activator/tetratricopeptide (TPR) repeat protein